MDIDEIKKELASKEDKKGYLRQLLKEESDPDRKHEIHELLIDIIKEKAIVKLPNNEAAEYHLVYDSVGEGMEPIYFWVLDFMRNDSPSGLGLEVNKTEEAFEASASSGYFGEMGAKASIMQDKAMKILETVNAVVKSVINLIYDLREFEIRLKTYDELKSKDSEIKESAELALRSLWMDQVDIKKGRGSINVMTQQLQFVTLRDAFMQAKDVSSVNKMDLNERVKNILKRKVEEYIPWKEMSEKELRKRYNIEREYLRTQVASLKLYTKWARPYLRAAQKLGMKEFRTKAGLPSPDIVSAFNNMLMELSLFGKKEIKPGSIFESYKKITFDKKVYACLEVDFKFRTIPRSVRAETGTHYLHGGTTDMFFRAYVFTDDEIKELEQEELYKDMELVENLTDVSLRELQEDLDHYFNEPQEEKKEETMFFGFLSKKKKTKKEKFEFPLFDAFKGFSEMFGPLKKGAGIFIPSGGSHKFELNVVRKAAEESALNFSLVIYDSYKKSHGMLTW